MKKEYLKPDLEEIELEVKDVIASQYPDGSIGVGEEDPDLWG